MGWVYDIGVVLSCGGFWGLGGEGVMMILYM